MSKRAKGLTKPRYRAQGPLTSGPTQWQQMWSVLDDKNCEAICLCWRAGQAQLIADVLNEARPERLEVGP